MTDRERQNIKVEIVERIGVLNSYPTGWNKEFNLVRWNDKPEKYDVRDWSPGHERMSRGVTMHEDEVKKLMELCEKRFSAAEENCSSKEVSADAAVPAMDMPEENADAEVPF